MEREITLEKELEENNVRLEKENIIVEGLPRDEYYNKEETDELLSYKADKTEIPTVPTKVSQLQNDVGYLTTETDPIFNASVAKGIKHQDITNWNNKLDSDDLTDYVKNTDYATNSVGGVIKIGSNAISINEGFLVADTRTYSNYTSAGNGIFIGKGTLENVITGKGLLTSSNIKTINNQSLIGTGNINIQGGDATDVQLNGTSIVVNGVADILTESEYDSTYNKIATMDDVLTRVPMEESSIFGGEHYIGNIYNQGNIIGMSVTNEDDGTYIESSIGGNGVVFSYLDENGDYTGYIGANDTGVDINSTAGVRITDVVAPTNNNDAVNKKYVDDLVGNISTVLATLTTI